MVLYYLAEDGVLAVELSEILVGERDEEVAVVHVRGLVAGAQHSKPVVHQTRLNLVFEIILVFQHAFTLRKYRVYYRRKQVLLHTCHKFKFTVEKCIVVELGFAQF